MNVSRSEPVGIEINRMEKHFSEEQLVVGQCSLEERNGDWQELERFWDEEKQRLQDAEGLSKPLSSSPEGHLMSGHFIVEPVSNRDQKKFSVKKLNPKFVKGEDIKDIPTSYAVDGFQPHELIAIGTYVDRRITPGFRYRVRPNDGRELLFGGKALALESVGQGYGKRLTFKGDSPLNCNRDYFWSDSRPGGFGLTLQVLDKGDLLSILDNRNGREVGCVAITSPVLSEDVELQTVLGEGRVKKEVLVHFRCDVTVGACTTADVEVRGVAVVVREGQSAAAKVKAITLQGFVVENCSLVPKE